MFKSSEEEEEDLKKEETEEEDLKEDKEEYEKTVLNVKSCIRIDNTICAFHYVYISLIFVH